MTAGKGIDGAGDADLLMEELKEERLLCVMEGGSIGNGKLSGVPGALGPGELISMA